MLGSLLPPDWGLLWIILEILWIVILLFLYGTCNSKEEKVRPKCGPFHFCSLTTCSSNWLLGHWPFRSSNKSRSFLPQSLCTCCLPCLGDVLTLPILQSFTLNINILSLGPIWEEETFPDTPKDVMFSSCAVFYLFYIALTSIFIYLQ